MLKYSSNFITNFFKKKNLEFEYLVQILILLRSNEKIKVYLTKYIAIEFTLIKVI